MAPRDGRTHLLCVENDRFSLVFEVDHEILTKRGEAYAGFMREVAGCVAQYFPKSAFPTASMR